MLYIISTYTHPPTHSFENLWVTISIICTPTISNGSILDVWQSSEYAPVNIEERFFIPGR